MQSPKYFTLHLALYICLVIRGGLAGSRETADPPRAEISGDHRCNGAAWRSKYDKVDVLDVPEALVCCGGRMRLVPSVMSVFHSINYL